MRHVWILALLFACGTSNSSSGGDDDASALVCSVTLEGTHCNPAQPYCAIEGNPGCRTPPTSGACNCNPDDGTWHCYCSCYGPQTTCEVACPATRDRASGATCDPVGYQCTYADRTCTCTDDGTGSLKFSCT